MPGLRELVAALDPDPSVRGRQWERICRWYLDNDPLYKSQVRRTWLWKQWPGRWGIDAGIDLVAELSDGSLMAVQAKAYAESYPVTKADVDSFLSESSRPKFTRRLIITTTNHIGKTALRTLHAQKVTAKFLALGELEGAAVPWPASPDDLLPRRLPPKTPRPDQKQAIQAVVDGFRTSDRGKLIMACGTGKTLVALWVAERLRAQRTLLLFPSLTLLDQTLREWTANAARPFDVLAVCSDESVVDRDAYVEHASDLDIPVVTDPRAIRTFLRAGGARVVFATYQSSPQIVRSLKTRGVPPFDLVIADEAHRCAGPISGAFATILDAKAIPATHRLFMTATPRYFTGRIKKVAAESDYVLASMDDTEHFGPVFYELSFGAAIKMNLLSDYQVAIIGIDDKTYRDYAQRRAFVSTYGKTVTDAGTLAGQIGLAKAMRKFGLRRTISFHGRIAGADAFSASMPEVVDWMPARTRPSGTLWSRFISGDMPTGDRRTLLGRFRELVPGERGLLANARCLAEGVDVPSIDGVAFIDPRSSQIDIVQAVGRAIRLSDEKKVGTIVLPVFIDTSMPPESALESTAFDPVWAVLRALRAHDDELGAELDELRRQLGRRPVAPLRMPSKIVFDVPIKVSREFAHAMRVRLVEATTSSFEQGIGELRGYRSETGNADVPREHVTASGFALGMWVHNLRNRMNLITSKRRALLDAEGFVWDPYRQDWERGVGAYKELTAMAGHANFKVEERVNGFRLGAWGANRRRERKRGKLADWKVEELDRMGFIWSPFDQKFSEFVRHLTEFKRERGHVRVTTDFSAGSYPLGKTLSHYRNARRRGLRLPPAKVAALDALGVVWEPYAEDFANGLEHLRLHKDATGRCDMRIDHVATDGFPLGRWLFKRKQERWSGRLRDGDARFAALTELGVDWSRKRAAYRRESLRG